MKIDFERIRQQSELYRSDISAFLRDMIAIPSESCQEAAVIERAYQEMKKVGFDQVEIDDFGNLHGYIGHGKHLIAMDGHIDTVGVGNAANWEFDPFEGKEDEDCVYGRGASDQEGGIASMIYAGKIIKDLGLEDDYTLVVTATIQEEDCDGLCWQYIIEKTGLRPEFVVISEPTSCRVYRGQRGRMEMKVSVSGVSAHGSAPERGDNAIYKMAPILLELQELNNNLGYDDFLGKGSLTVSEIFHSSPSRCAVADGCHISIDRRLTVGETMESAVAEIENLPAVQKAGAKVEVYDYVRPTYQGVTFPTKAYFPTWLIDKDHAATKTAVEAYHSLYGTDPIVDKWTFSTNGVSIMGKYGIPCIGFGPGHEDQAHAPNERTWKDELVMAAAVYAAIPAVYVQKFCD